jgi:diacylglycerol kinase family enzyme
MTPTKASPDKTSGTRKVGVILNKNARRFTRRLPDDIARIVPRRHIWVTGSLEDARQAVEQMMQEDFDVIFTGGGDGTIVTTLSAIRNILASGRDVPVPPIGLLKLGTGNAWTYAVQARSGLSQLAHVVRGGYYFTADYSLIQVDDLLCPFAGLGWDAQVLNDYYDFNEIHRNRFISRFTKGLFGYSLAVATRTIPRFTGGQNLAEVEVTFTGQNLYKPDRNGNYFPITDRGNAVIYRGPASIVAAGTIPFFGYKIRAFPYACRVPKTMHLRIANADVADALQHLTGIWRGTYFSSDIIDFLADRVRITFTSDQPIELGGDPKGYRRSVDFSISDFTATIVAFWGI